MSERPSRISNLRELVALMSLSVQVQGEIASILDDYDQRIYSLEEDRKRLLASNKDYHLKLQSLERRYSDLLYQLSLKKD